MAVDLVAAQLDQVHERIGGPFWRSEPQARVRDYVSGLVPGPERKNGWTLAERAGEAGPDGMQGLLRRADWDIGDARDCVIENLGHPGGVLIADETGFMKNGTRSAGVRRQYSGTAGRTENCQVGVFLAYASVHGHALIDPELYLPSSWTGDRGRCREAGIPEDAQSAPKAQLAQAMLSRVTGARMPFGRYWSRRDPAAASAPHGRWTACALTGPGRPLRVQRLPARN
jgi:SRSO17 transposase